MMYKYVQNDNNLSIILHNLGTQYETYFFLVLCLWTITKKMHHARKDSVWTCCFGMRPLSSPFKLLTNP